MTLLTAIDPIAVEYRKKVRRLAAEGYGWEDIVLELDGVVDRETCRKIMFDDWHAAQHRMHRGQS